MKRRPPNLDKPYPKHRPVSEDEAHVWRAHMGEVEESEKEASPPLTPPAGGRGRRDLSTLPPLAGGDGGGKRRKQAEANISPEPLDKASASKIRRGRWEVEATLDLHGHTKATAHTALIRFIARAQERGWGLALIITGKGRLSGGALREMLPRWLDESPLRANIIAYDTAGPRHGGDGAWYVRIRKAGVRDRGPGIRF